MKSAYLEEIKNNNVITGSFMIMKKLTMEGNNFIGFIGDKTGDIKAYIPDKEGMLKVGLVIDVKGTKENIFKVEEYTVVDNYDMKDYLPAVKKPIEDIMKEIEQISQEEYKSDEARTLNDYFFKKDEFVQSFKNGIGGLSMHHNYIGGLAEHTLNVMYMAKMLAYRYDCRYKEIAILAAKLHDIGKTVEYSANGPFSVTMRGEMEGHIVIGITMLEEAFKAGGAIYSDNFKHRIRGCVVQHHGKVEYGSPKAPNSEEAYIVHYADYIDATFNKIEQVRDITSPGTWSEYDRRIGTKLYI
jgi:3'-5' exoribonuclease